MMPHESKDLLREVFGYVFTAEDLAEEHILRYFSPLYVQVVDGQELDYRAFVRHLIALRRIARSIDVEFETLLAEGNILFSRHRVRVEKLCGEISSFRVLAEFEIQEGRIVRCHELTHALSGGEEDRDLGSRIEY